MNIDVLSFARLAYRVFEETGGGMLPVLDDVGKNLILRKIAGDYEEKLCVLKGNMKKLGYITEVKSVISEFTQYDIGEEELLAVMESIGTESRLYYKLQDIRVLYKGFTEYLSRKYITKEELLDSLSRVIGQSEMLKNSTVVLDGFTGFTPVQNRLLLQLLRHCRKVVVTVTMDEREDPYVYSHPYQLFALSKHMVSTLVRLARDVASLYIRIPVIREVNGNEKNMKETIMFLKKHDIHPPQINLLPYHDTGSGKYPKLDREYKGTDLHAPDRAEMEEFVRLFQEAGFQNTKIGG